MSQCPQITTGRWDGVREVMGMSWPIILGSFSYTFMEFADRTMVAQLGTESIAAVGSAGIWSFILSTVFLGIVGCVSTFVALSRVLFTRFRSERWRHINIFSEPVRV